MTEALTSIEALLPPTVSLLELGWVVPLVVWTGRAAWRTRRSWRVYRRCGADPATCAAQRLTFLIRVVRAGLLTVAFLALLLIGMLAMTLPQSAAAQADDWRVWATTGVFLLAVNLFGVKDEIVDWLEDRALRLYELERAERGDAS